MPSFKNINFAIADQVAEGNQSRLKTLSYIAASASGAVPGTRPMGVELDDQQVESARVLADDLSSHSAEAATRLQLQTYLEDAGNEWMAELTSPQAPSW